ncbi:MAG TPA: fasciclin domain-containing protein, partial [Flavobacterium sp.]|nr:fasciclin domain-containing protein [Flavobacterium sp.]
MKKFQNLTKGVIAMLMLTVAVSCSDDDNDNPNPQPKSIAETAQATPELSSLVAALQRADLVSVLDADGDYTVFAPTNTAFAAFLSANGFASL